MDAIHAIAKEKENPGQQATHKTTTNATKLSAKQNAAALSRTGGTEIAAIQAITSCNAQKRRVMRLLRMATLGWHSQKRH